jgi:16S rRNA (adenine1518-N6/adenine1519-N6)-dimethyltransferase
VGGISLCMNHKISLKNVLLNRGLKPKKSFGQNFMVDQHINSILSATVSSFGNNLPIIEIGAGTGLLTNHLLKISTPVHVIERDRDLIPLLKEQFVFHIAEHQLIIHEADGTRFDLAQVLSTKNPGILVGNLPYHLTSSIMLLALRNSSLLKGAVFLVQKEVADRLVAVPHNKQYGFLTAVLKLAFDIQQVAQVDKTAFWPIPKVDSTIIKMTIADHGISHVGDLDAYIIFVREIFQKRRKKLSTILTGKMNKENLISLNIDPNLRPENLLPSQFLTMFLEYTKITE